MPDRCKQQPKTRFSTCKTEVVHRCKKWAQKCPYFGRLSRCECRFRPFSAQTQSVLQYSLSFSWRNTWNRYLAIFYEEWWSEILENRCCPVKASHLKKSWIQNVEDKIGWKKLTYLVLSVKPAKDSTYQGWFVEYGAVAAPLPVIMLASLSFLHLKTSTYDLQIRSSGFIMGVNFF